MPHIAIEQITIRLRNTPEIQARSLIYGLESELLRQLREQALAEKCCDKDRIESINITLETDGKNESSRLRRDICRSLAKSIMTTSKTSPGGNDS